MSVKVYLVDTNDEEVCEALTLTPSDTDYGVKDPIECYDIFEDEEEGKSVKCMSIPMNYYRTNPDAFPERPDPPPFPPVSTPYTFEGTLKEDQKKIRDDCLAKLNKSNTLLLSLCTGGGKTVMGIYLVHKIGLKSCILVHRKFLIDQWVERISQFAPDAVVQVIHTRTRINIEADIYIMNIDNAHKRDHNYFSSIGTLVIDEAHTACSPTRIQSLTRFYPKYLLCLTATPDERKDHIDMEMFNLFVGAESRVHLPLWREHTVYKFDTNFFPQIKYSRMGKLDWNSILGQQAENVKRNQYIIDVIQKFKGIHFIVLCKRIVQAKYLYNQLKEMGDNVDIYTGEHKYFNFNTRILISSFSKTGLGFDWVPKSVNGEPLDMGLIMASDVEAYFRQYLGRVFRSDKSPIVIDFVDKFAPMVNHWKTRSKVYLDTGGEIKNYHAFFSEEG
jgi:superfamily II DNA or RNA helicase